MIPDEIELPSEVHEAIVRYCEVGDKLAEDRRFDAALDEYNKAWELVPEPKNEWEASTWILGAVADASFLAGYKKTAREALRYVMTCPGAIGNPFLHMRYGQVLLDAGEEEAAADELIRAYMGAGAEIFEDEDPKYFAFLKTRAKL